MPISSWNRTVGSETKLGHLMYARLVARAASRHGAHRTLVHRLLKSEGVIYMSKVTVSARRNVMKKLREIDRTIAKRADELEREWKQRH